MLGDVSDYHQALSRELRTLGLLFEPAVKGWHDPERGLVATYLARSLRVERSTPLAHRTFTSSARTPTAQAAELADKLRRWLKENED